MLPLVIAEVCFLWLQAWNTTGDSYSIHPGDKPWISEMYGYSYACAAADVWHKVDFSAMLYPAYFSASKYKLASFAIYLDLLPSTPPCTGCVSCSSKIVDKCCTVVAQPCHHVPSYSSGLSQACILHAPPLAFDIPAACKIGRCNSILLSSWCQSKTHRPEAIPDCCACTAAPPKVLHYGLIYTVANTNYTFDKHWHYDFDATACPPWDMGTDRPKKGLFPHPPRASSFTTKVSSVTQPK